jgi:hypothetical protein
MSADVEPTIKPTIEPTIETSIFRADTGAEEIHEGSKCALRSPLRTC